MTIRLGLGRYNRFPPFIQRHSPIQADDVGGSLGHRRKKGGSVDPKIDHGIPSERIRCTSSVAAGRQYCL